MKAQARVVQNHAFVLAPLCDLLPTPTRAPAGPRIAVSRASDSQVRGPGFDNQSGHIQVLSFLLLLIQEGQLSVTGACRLQFRSGFEVIKNFTELSMNFFLLINRKNRIISLSEP